MDFREKMAKLSQQNIPSHNNNDNNEGVSNNQQKNLQEDKYLNDNLNDYVFDLTNSENLDSFQSNQKSNGEQSDSFIDLTNKKDVQEDTIDLSSNSTANHKDDLTNNSSSNSGMIDLTGNNSGQKDDMIDLSNNNHNNEVDTIDLSSNQSIDTPVTDTNDNIDEMTFNQDDLNSLMGVSNDKDKVEDDNNVIVKSTKASKYRKKTKKELLEDYINENRNFWYRMNALYINPDNYNPNINYATLSRIPNPEEIDFNELKKKNYKFYKAIEDSLNELKGKYDTLIDEIKKSNLFEQFIDSGNVKLEDINVEQLRSILLHKYDSKIRSFLKNFNPYHKTFKDGTVTQEPKDLAPFKTEFEQDVIYDVLGYSSIFPFLKNKEITEIMTIGPYKVYIEMNGKLIKTKVSYVNDDPLKRYAREIASSIDRPLDSVHLSVDARLPDGSRFHGIISPVSRFGTTLTIRKFNEDKLTLDDLQNQFDSLNENMSDMIKSSVASKLNVVVAGGTGSGKTTMLNICSHYIGGTERVITVEDSAELQLTQDHVVSLETKESKDDSKGKAYTIRDLVKECLRMRPDRIICGEVRGGEAWDMLVAMNTGHEGSMTTVHSNNPIDTIKRISNMVAQVAGDGVPMRVIYEQIASSVDMIVYQSRLVDGSRKTTYISEVKGYNVVTQQVEINDIYRFVITGQDEEGNLIGDFKWTGNLPSDEMVYRVHSKGYRFPDEIEDGLEAAKGQKRTDMSLEEERHFIDNFDEADAKFKERIKLALEVLRNKESENEVDIIQESDFPRSLKNKLINALNDKYDYGSSI